MSIYAMHDNDSRATIYHIAPSELRRGVHASALRMDEKFNLLGGTVDVYRAKSRQPASILVVSSLLISSSLPETPQITASALGLSTRRRI